MFDISDSETDVENTIANFADAGADFIAADVSGIDEGVLGILYHTPVNVALDVTVGHSDEIRLNNDTFSLRSAHVLPTERHFHQRIPLYADGVPGLDDVSIESGAASLRRFLSEDQSLPSIESSTVPLREAAEALVAEGAVAIEVEKELLRLGMDNDDRSFTTDIRAHLPPADGYDAIGEMGDLELGYHTIEPNWIFTLDGPSGGEGGIRIPLYAGENILGMRAIPIDEGIARLEAYLDGLDDGARFG